MPISLTTISVSQVISTLVIAVIAFVPITISLVNQAETIAIDSLKHEAATISAETMSVIEVVAKNVDYTASLFNTLPTMSEIVRHFYHAFASSKVLYFIMGTETGNMYALWKGDQATGVPYELGMIDPIANGHSCRDDSYIQSAALPSQIVVESRFNQRCGYDPRLRSWYGGLNHSSLHVTKMSPHSGKVPPWSALFMGRQLQHDDGTPFGVISVEFHNAVFSEYLTKFSENSVSVAMEVSTGNILGSSYDQTLFDDAQYDPTAVKPVVAYFQIDRIDHPIFSRFLEKDMDLMRSPDVMTHEVLKEGNVIMVVNDLTLSYCTGLHIRLFVLQDLGNTFLDDVRNTAMTIAVIVIVFWIVLTVWQLFVAMQMHKSANNLSLIMARMERDLERLGAEDSDDDEQPDDSTSFVLEIAIIQSRFEQMRVVLMATTKYIPREVIGLLLQNGDDVGVFMEPAHVAVLFIDIESFTTMSERLDPDTLTEFLLHYFEIQSDIIILNGGVIDKFIGDAIMCTWAAPTIVGDHELRITATSVMLRDVLSSPSNQRFFESIGVECRVRVGAHSGQVVAGNIGCSTRLSYTVLGDPVNTASRLEALNKHFGTRCLVSAAIAEPIMEESAFVFRLVGNVKVSGKSEATRCYEVVGIPARDHHSAKHHSSKHHTLPGTPVSVVDLETSPVGRRGSAHSSKTALQQQTDWILVQQRQA